MDSPTAYIIYYIVISLFLLLSVFIGKRASCHYICWMSPFMILGKKFGEILHIPSFKLSYISESCINCKKCNNSCPMSIDVNSQVINSSNQHDECILCYECIDICPKKF